MARYHGCKHAWAAVTLGFGLMAGCQNVEPRGPVPPGAIPGAQTKAKVSSPKLSGAQVADVQVALGRSLEQSEEADQAAAAYTEALKHDPSRADALDRLAVLHDQQNQFAASAKLHQQALALQPKNADLHCNLGYSLYLQHDWVAAEVSLRKAIALAPEHSRAHNNLGLVLAHTGREGEALAEFRKAGCNEADAQVNLAFVLTLEKHWPEARQHYQQALATTPSSPTANEGLRQLSTLMARPASTIEACDASCTSVPPAYLPSVQSERLAAQPVSLGRPVAAEE